MGVNLHEKGIARVRERCRIMCLTQAGLAESSYVSSATVRRFVSGKVISLASFKAMCTALDLPEWQELIDTEVKQIRDQDKTSEEMSPVALAVTGLFEPSKQMQIRAVLEALKELLLESKVIIMACGDDPSD